MPNYYKKSLVDGKEVKWVDETHQTAVSNTGKVYVLNKHDMLYERKINPNKVHGYCLAYCRINGKNTARYVHVLVAEAFISKKPFENAQVDHINGIKHDNRVENLQWVTPKENCQKYHRTRKSSGTTATKIRFGRCMEIEEVDKEGNVIEKYDSIKTAARKISLLENGDFSKANSIATMISFCIAGKSGSKTCHGRIFRIADPVIGKLRAKYSSSNLTPEEIELITKIKKHCAEINKENRDNRATGEAINEVTVTKYEPKMKVTIEMKVKTDSTGRIDISQIA